MWWQSCAVIQTELAAPSPRYSLDRLRKQTSKFLTKSIRQKSSMIELVTLIPQKAFINSIILPNLKEVNKNLICLRDHFSIKRLNHRTLAKIVRNKLFTTRSVSKEWTLPKKSSKSVLSWNHWGIGIMHNSRTRSMPSSTVLSQMSSHSTFTNNQALNYWWMTIKQ